MMPQVILKHISDRDHGETMEIYVDDILVRTLGVDVDTDASETLELKKSVIFDFITALENQGFEIVRDEHYRR
jgi:hypothetical protein